MRQESELATATFSEFSRVFSTSKLIVVEFFQMKCSHQI